MEFTELLRLFGEASINLVFIAYLIYDRQIIIKSLQQTLNDNTKALKELKTMIKYMKK